MKLKFFQVSERAGQAVAALQEPGHGVQRADGAEAGPGHRHEHHQGPRRHVDRARDVIQEDNHHNCTVTS